MNLDALVERERKKKSASYRIAVYLVTLLTVLLLGVPVAWLVSTCWNAAMPHLLGWEEIDTRQAYALMVLVGIGSGLFNVGRRKI